MKSVVFALIIREIKTRFGQYHLGYVWAFGEPLAHIVVLSIIFGLRSRTAPADIEFPVFLATGIIPWLYFKTMFMRSVSSITMNKPLFNYRQVKPLDTIIARAILETAIYSIIFIVFLVGLAWLDYDVSVQDPLPVLLVFLSFGLFGIGLGATFCVASSFVRDINQVVPLMLRPLYFLSGIIFAVERIPSEYREYALWNPLLHGMELLRSSYFYRIEPVYCDTMYFTWWILGSLSLGLITFRVYRIRMIAS